MKKYFTLTSSTGIELIRTTKLENLVAKMYSYDTHACGKARVEISKGNLFNRVITTTTLPEAGYGETKAQYLARLTTIVNKI
jgi:hypothetical protein